MYRHRIALTPKKLQLLKEAFFCKYPKLGQVAKALLSTLLVTSLPGGVLQVLLAKTHVLLGTVPSKAGISHSTNVLHIGILVLHLWHVKYIRCYSDINVNVFSK